MIFARWLCPNRPGTTLLSAVLAEDAVAIRCSACGQRHAILLLEQLREEIFGPRRVLTPETWAAEREHWRGAILMKDATADEIEEYRDLDRKDAGRRQHWYQV